MSFLPDIQRRAFELERSEISLCLVQRKRRNILNGFFVLSRTDVSAACSLIKSGAATSRTSLKRTPFFKIGFHCRTFSCLKTPIRHRNNAFEGLLASDLLSLRTAEGQRYLVLAAVQNHFLRSTQFSQGSSNEICFALDKSEAA